MGRKPTSSTDRLDHLVESAIGVFMEMSYRRAQIADIARAMGVAPGTIYLYVESKEALFDLALQRAFGHVATTLPSLPVKTPEPREILQRVQTEFARQSGASTLKAALAGHAESDPRSEVETVVGELYDALRMQWRAIKMLQRSAKDWPELADVFYHDIRRGILQNLTNYLTRRIEQGKLPQVPDVPTAARLLLETVAWFAVHRAGDRDAAVITEESARATVVALLGRAFAPTASWTESLC